MSFLYAEMVACVQLQLFFQVLCRLKVFFLGHRYLAFLVTFCGSLLLHVILHFFKKNVEFILHF